MTSSNTNNNKSNNNNSDSVMNSALYERTSIIVGDEGLRRLQNAKVLVVGVGGVGGHCAESLVRSGVGNLYICDHDVVSLTNKNRQLSALDSTVGKSKARVLAARFADINRACKVHIIDAFLLPEDIPEILEREDFDVVVDAIDSVDCKLALIVACAKRNICIFVSGGAGGRVDPLAIKYGDIFETQNDGLLKRMRADLKRYGVEHGQVECIHSTEKARPPLPPAKQEAGGRDRAVNGTMSYLPPLFGLVISSRVITYLMDPVAYRKEMAAAEKRRLKKLLHSMDDAAAATATATGKGNNSNSNDINSRRRNRETVNNNNNNNGKDGEGQNQKKQPE